MSGFVYFVSYPDSVWIKVGYARDVKARFEQLLCATPEQLEVLATIPSPPSGERKLHKALRGPRRREWFLRDVQVEMALALAQDGQDVASILTALEASYASKEIAEREARIDRLNRHIENGATDEGVRKVYERILANIR